MKFREEFKEIDKKKRQFEKVTEMAKKDISSIQLVFLNTKT